jgi:hypothetical protein
MTAPLVLDDLTYISIADAVAGSHLSSEYLVRLAKRGRLRGRMVAHMWFIEMHSLQQFPLRQKIVRVGATKSAENDLHEPNVSMRVDASVPSSQLA